MAEMPTFSMTVRSFNEIHSNIIHRPPASFWVDGKLKSGLEWPKDLATSYIVISSDSLSLAVAS